MMHYRLWSRNVTVYMYLRLNNFRTVLFTAEATVSGVARIFVWEVPQKVPKRDDEGVENGGN